MRLFGDERLHRYALHPDFVAIVAGLVLVDRGLVLERKLHAPLEIAPAAAGALGERRHLVLKKHHDDGVAMRIADVGNVAMPVAGEEVDFHALAVALSLGHIEIDVILVAVVRVAGSREAVAQFRRHVDVVHVIGHEQQTIGLRELVRTCRLVLGRMGRRDDGARGHQRGQ